MLAGSVYIDIAARTSMLDKGLEEAKAKSVKAGGEAGKSFGYDFGGKFTEQARGVMGTLAGPMIAATLAKGMAGFLRSDKETPEALLDMFKTIPFAGAFVDLGEAIYDATAGAADKAAEHMRELEAAARASRLTMAAEREAEARAEAERVLALRNADYRMRLEEEVAKVRAAGDERAAVVAEAQAKAQQLYYDLQFEMAREMSDQERVLIEERHARQLRMIELQAQAQLDKLDEQDAKQAEAAAKQAEAAAKQAAKEEESQLAKVQALEDALAMRQVELKYVDAIASTDAQAARAAQLEQAQAMRALEHQARLRDAQSQDEREALTSLYELEEQLAAKQAETDRAVADSVAQTSSATTALGAFTFDPYPKLRQREVQERTMRATEKMAAAGGTGGFA